MWFTLVAFVLWLLCLALYVALGWKKLLDMRNSRLTQPESPDEDERTYELHKVASRDGDDIATYLCRQGYELGSILGKGAYAEVKEAYSNKLGRNVAVKIIEKAKLSSKSFNKFMRREVEALRQVDHKYVISLIEVLESSKRFYLVLELAQNGDLLQLLQKKKHLHENEARKIFKKIVKGVLHCHRKGIAHRDLKLENILLSRKNEPIISDFGFARYVGGSSDTCMTRPRSNTFCGSYAYAAPEILQGIPYDATSSDVWSLGVVLFAMVTGRFPFDDQDRRQLLRHTLAGKFSYPKGSARLSDQLKELVKNMLTADIKSRLTLEEVYDHPWIRGAKHVTSKVSRDKTHSFALVSDTMSRE